MANVSRRYVLRTGLAAGAAVAAARCGGAPEGTPNNPATGPEVNTNQIKDVTLRLIGTGVSQINEIRDKAQEDLGFSLDMRALSTEENNQIAITQPDQYDIFDGEYFSLPLVVPSGNLRPIEIAKVSDWDKIVSFFTSGEYEGMPVEASQGTAPYKVMYLTGPDSTEFSDTPTDFATLIPFQYNADTLGYRPDLITRPIETWGELFNEEFRGKTSILDIPQIGIMDAALVAESLGHQSSIHDACCSGGRVVGSDDVCRQRQHDQGRNRSDYRHPQRAKGRWSVPRLLEDFRRVGQPDGLG